jgi:hypothetical protein
MNSLDICEDKDTSSSTNHYDTFRYSTRHRLEVHCRFVLRDPESGRHTYADLVESTWHTLSNRICADTRGDKNSIWLPSGMVEWKDKQAQIHRPIMYIPYKVL